MEISTNKINQKIILLGNEAAVRGALEAGVQFVSTFPGTPASEVGNAFFKLYQSKKFKGYFEFSTNEKVALEAGVGASYSGLKTLVAMKNFGLNVALESLLPFVYTGSKGPTVIFVADDPSCHSSAQSEENTRGLDLTAHIPTLEPSDPQECKDFVKLAFRLSKRFKIPVMVRTTTRVSHQRAPVKLSKIPSVQAKGDFVKDRKRFVTMPPRVLEMKAELLEKMEKIREFAEKSSVNFQSKKTAKGAGIITSGISHLYVMEALKELKLDLPILKLGFFNPLPEKKIKSFIKNLKEVLVTEELEPFLEREVQRLAKESNHKLKISGKNLLPQVGELRPEIVIKAVAEFQKKKFRVNLPKSDVTVPKRFPQLCPGCPYWLVFNGIKKAVNEKEVVFGGDIGCYMLAGFPPHLIQDYLSSMGSSIGIGHGIRKSTNRKLIALIGDSTFFHAGIPALVNTVFNHSNPLVVIMDNQTTAMTGHQPHPGAPIVPNGVKIENIVSALGIKNLKIIDPGEHQEFVKTIKEFFQKDEVSVIIARRPCVFIAKKQK